ncbi:putative membrane protein [Lysobacter antibioticus]|uniref:hypothetical protein n=1 Tax=Lysobacter antibioticus TaxID=84531 RepID=UPI00071F0D17|nr:hypothetical protein [Lysobacter antibioticus]ALN63925.1 putative membrane protein [Lysobacter antibioticus]
MASLWPWMVVAGLGALHGLSPATGWMFAAACGVRDKAQVWRALLPIAIGHVLSIAIVAYAFAQGLQMDRVQVQGVAGALLMCVASYRWLRGARPPAPQSANAGSAGIALWSFLMATVHGSGLMLVPALAPMCLSGSPAREITASGSMILALAAVAVHMAATLATTGVIAAAVSRGVAAQAHRLSGVAASRAWSAVLAITGVLLIVLR